MKEQRDATNQKSLSVSRVMSAPSVDVQEHCKVRLVCVCLFAMIVMKTTTLTHMQHTYTHKISGYGLGLVGVPIEQDAAYWEAHIEHDSGMSQEVLFGVATRKDQQFYRAMEEQGEFRTRTRSL